MDFEKKLLTKKSENISKWYNDIVFLAELADYGPSKGTMVIRPYGYAIWENIQKALDGKIKASGVKNAYFPLFIPEKLFRKEKDHIEGFSPECAVVTIGGGEELEEKLIVRPTSEMVMYNLYSKWIKSWRDLPLVINQWNNVVRWEKRPYMFLRTTEFLWQEGHGAHATKEDNWERVLWGINTYAEIYRDFLAVDGLVGEKSESEKFAGADKTLTYEILIPDGKVLQGCTSHDLGQNFSKVLDISFQDKDGSRQFVWQNSWGFSTRSVGTTVLVHGDDQGLVLPPKVAPIKVVIIPVLGKNDEKILKFTQKIKGYIEALSSEFPGEVEIWDDTEKTLGWKINEAEIKGIPIRITVGNRELTERTVNMDFRVNIKNLKTAKAADVGESVEKALKEIQSELFAKSSRFMKENINEVGDFDEFKKVMVGKRGFIYAFWCGRKDCETNIKYFTKASTRCLVMKAKEEIGKCIYCGKDAKLKWYFGQSY
jgi:prolyl-tRNA synthetase